MFLIGFAGGLEKNKRPAGVFNSFNSLLSRSGFWAHAAPPTVAPLSYNWGMDDDVPQIDLEALLASIGAEFPTAVTKAEFINPDYRSWRIQVFLLGHRFHIFWGPLSGFGATHVCHRSEDDPDPAMPYDQSLHSVGDVVRFIRDETKPTLT